MKKRWLPALTGTLLVASLLTVGCGGKKTPNRIAVLETSMGTIKFELYNQVVRAIRRAYRGDLAHRHVTAISQHHRIQASPGYRTAAGYVADRLTAAGLETRICSYRADGRARFWTTPIFLHWSCVSATLHLLGSDSAPSRLLCDFEAVPTSVIQRSVAVDGELEIIAPGATGGKTPSDYNGLDVRGKLVLTDQPVPYVRTLAVAQRGAAGILFDECLHHANALLCFDPGHGHRYGAPVYANDRKLIENFEKISASADPEFLFAGEACYDWEMQVYQVSYHRSENKQHIPLSRYMLPEAQFMTAVTGFNDRSMVNQCLMYRYIISYEPYNFKGHLDDYPLTMAYGEQMDALLELARQGIGSLVAAQKAALQL